MGLRHMQSSQRGTFVCRTPAEETLPGVVGRCRRAHSITRCESEILTDNALIAWVAYFSEGVLRFGHCATCAFSEVRYPHKEGLYKLSLFDFKSLLFIANRKCKYADDLCE